MFNAKELRERINNCRSSLLAINAQAKERARIGRANEIKSKELTQSLQAAIIARDNVRECINHTTAIYKNIEKYAVDRKELALTMLKESIEQAGYIVPDAQTKGVKLVTKDKHARIVDDKGTDVNLREGSAYRTVLGMLIRYTLLKAQPDAMQVMFLDELFNTLSDETIVAMREYLAIFKEDILIVGIEQRDITFQGIVDVELQAVKDSNNKTIIKRKE